MFTKYARFEGVQVLDIKSAPTKQKHASLDKLSEFDKFRTENDYLYVRIRAISSRTNANYDGWPSSQLAGGQEVLNQHLASNSEDGFIIEANKNAKYGFSTFLRRPIFVDHNNSDPKRARGIVVDAKLHVENPSKIAKLDPYYATAPEYYHPPTWVELLLEIDARSFPKLAKAIIDGAKDPEKGIDGFSMGANVKYTTCSLPWCENKAYEEHEFCQHSKMKGAKFTGLNPKTGKRETWTAWENCYEPNFFELSCFTPDTPILMENGSSKPISEVQIGDKVIDHQGDPQKVTQIMKRPFRDEILQIHRSGYGYKLPLEVTPEHPILVIKDQDLPTQDKALDRRSRKLRRLLAEGKIQPQWVTADQLQVNDWLVEVIPQHFVDRTPSPLTQGRVRYGKNWLTRITKIDHKSYQGFVYNLEVENTHTYVARGVAVHNCVFSPADETALTQELITDIRREGRNKTASNWNKVLKGETDPNKTPFDPVNFMDENRTCPRCRGQLDPDHAMACVTCGFQHTAAGQYPDIQGDEHYFEMPCEKCKGLGVIQGEDCPFCHGEGVEDAGMYAQPKGDITGLTGRNPEDYQKMPDRIQDSLFNMTPSYGSFMKGSPEPGDDQYFGGKPGSARKAYDSMIKEYGKEEGEKVFFATRNKHKGKDSSLHTAENPDQIDTDPDPEKECAQCGAQLKPSNYGLCDKCEEKSFGHLGSFQKGSWNHKLKLGWDPQTNPGEKMYIDPNTGLYTHPESQAGNHLYGENRPFCPVCKVDAGYDPETGRCNECGYKVAPGSPNAEHYYGEGMYPSQWSKGFLSTNEPIDDLEGREQYINELQRSRQQKEQAYDEVYRQLKQQNPQMDPDTLWDMVEQQVQQRLGKIATDLPQSDLLSAPEKVDTLRRPEVCDVCGSSRDHGEKCPVCHYAPPPDSLDNPDLAKSREMVNQNDPNNGSHIEGYPDNLEQARQGPPPRVAPPNFQSNAHTVIGDMEWEFFHPKLGMGKINPIERPVLPTGPPATNEPVRETVISQPSGPVTSSKTAAQMIAAVKQKENQMERTADAASGAPAVATPDANVDVIDVGSVLDGSNEEASKADAQVNLLDIGSAGPTDVGADHDSIEQSAGGDGTDAGFNADKTTDGSGPTITWDLSYGDGSAVEKQEGPVTREPFPASEDGVKAVSSSQHTALDAEPFPSDDGPGLAGGSANSGTEPADPVGKAQDRVDVLSPATTPEGNNSGPTITWTGTDGNSYSRQQEPVTNETLEGADGVKRSSFTPHIVNAMKLADLEIEIGVLSKEDKYNRLAALAETSPDILAAELRAYSKVKTAGLRKAPSITRTAGRVPSFNKAASESSAPAPVYDESLFM